MCTSYLYLIKPLQNTIHSESFWNPTSTEPGGVYMMFINVGCWGPLNDHSQEKLLTLQSFLWTQDFLRWQASPWTPLKSLVGGGWQVPSVYSWRAEGLLTLLLMSQWLTVLLDLGFPTEHSCRFCAPAPGPVVAGCWEPPWEAVPPGGSCQWDQMLYEGREGWGTAYFDCILSSMAEIPTLCFLGLKSKFIGSACSRV